MFLAHKKSQSTFSACCSPLPQSLEVPQTLNYQKHPLKKSLRHIYVPQKTSKRFVSQLYTSSVTNHKEAPLKKYSSRPLINFCYKKEQKTLRFQASEKVINRGYEPMEEYRPKISIKYSQPQLKRQVVRDEIQYIGANKGQQNGVRFSQQYLPPRKAVPQFFKDRNGKKEAESPQLRMKPATPIQDEQKNEQTNSYNAMNPEIHSAVLIDLVQSQGQITVSAPQTHKNPSKIQKGSITDSLEKVSLAVFSTQDELKEDSPVKIPIKKGRLGSLFSKVRKTETMYENIDDRTDSSGESIVMDNYKSLLAKVEEENMENSRLLQI